LDKFKISAFRWKVACSKGLSPIKTTAIKREGFWWWVVGGGKRGHEIDLSNGKRIALVGCLTNQSDGSLIYLGLMSLCWAGVW